MHLSIGTAPGSELYSLELALRGRLIEAYDAHLDICNVIVFPLHWRACHASQDRDLTDMRERIGDRALKQFFWRRLQGFIRRQEVVKLFQGGEKSFHSLLPWQRRRVLPFLLAHGDRQGPVEQIADVRENLSRRSQSFTAMKVSEAGGRVANRFSATISERGQRVAQQFSFGISNRGGRIGFGHGDKVTLEPRRRKAWRMKSHGLNLAR